MALETAGGALHVHVSNPGAGTTAAFAFEELPVSTTAVGFTEATYDDATVAVCYVTGANNIGLLTVREV